MLEAVCGPEHMHEEGGDAHGNIDDRDLDGGNSDQDGDNIGVFTSASNASELDHSDDENSNDGGDSSYYDAENNANQSNNDKE